MLNRREITEYCVYKLDLNDFEITNQGVNVNGDVWFNDMLLDKIPFKFNKVNGNFLCHQNKLLNLQGAPNIVTGDFYCQSNRLSTLYGGPMQVGGNYYAYANWISNLYHSPLIIGGDFLLMDNNISSIYNNFDINVSGQVLIDVIDLPNEFIKMRKLDFRTFLKYQRHFEVWNNKKKLNITSFDMLVEEIKDGLL